MAQRQDARRNREKLLVAAREVLHTGGASAPLDQIARRAGVGRATLYRNFPDRSSLFEALFEERLGRLEEMVATYDGDDVFERLVVEICWYEVEMPGLAAVLTGLPVQEHADLHRVMDRTEDLLGLALKRSADAGALRGDVQVRDAQTILAMLEGAIRLDGSGRPGDTLERALVLLLDGLRSAARTGAAVPRPALGDLHQQ